MSTAWKERGDTARRQQHLQLQERRCICGRRPASPERVDPARYSSVGVIWAVSFARIITSHAQKPERRSR